VQRAVKTERQANAGPAPSAEHFPHGNYRPDWEAGHVIGGQPIHESSRPEFQLVRARWVSAAHLTDVPSLGRWNLPQQFQPAVIHYLVDNTTA
jgi:hypothetical protein